MFGTIDPSPDNTCLKYNLLCQSGYIIDNLGRYFDLCEQAKQLKDYENAVIAKRLEELDEDEIQALVEDIERDDF